MAHEHLAAIKLDVKIHLMQYLKDTEDAEFARLIARLSITNTGCSAPQLALCRPGVREQGGCRTSSVVLHPGRARAYRSG
jgi:hypothetical protein